MTSPGARYSAGTAFLDVVPSFRGVQEAIRKKAKEMEKALGQEAGDQFGKSFGESATKAVDKALGTTQAKESEKHGKEAGEKYAGAFATEVKRAVAAANREIKSTIELTGDDDKLRAKLREIEVRLTSLSKTKIGIDLDASTVVAEIGAIRALLARMQDEAKLDASINFGEAYKAIEKAEKRLKALNDVDIEVEVKFDEKKLGLFERSIRQRLKAAMESIPDVAFNADVTPAMNRLQALRAEMQMLMDKRIGVDIAGKDALTEMTRLRAALTALRSDTNVDVKVRADAGAAAAELLQIKTLVDLIDGKTINVKTKLDDNSFSSRIHKIRNTLQGTGQDGQDAANGFRAFNAIVLAGASILPAAVPVLGALAGGLALLGPLALGAAAGLGVLGIAFTGVGDAVKAISKVQDDGAQEAVALAKRQNAAARSVADASRAVARAEQSGAQQVTAANRAVSDARENAARVASDAAKRVADAVDAQKDAEKDLASAQKAVQRAQEDLTRARAEATEQMEDLQLAVRGGALSERDAVLDLKEAQEALADARAEGMEGDDLDRLILKYDQAAFRLDEVRERNGDLSQEQAEWARTGVEGSDRVRQAQEGVANAQDGVRAAVERLGDATANIAKAQADGERARADAARQVADAVAAQRDAEVNAAQSAEDARRNLAQAQEDYNTVLGETTASADALHDAMMKLGPAGQDFAYFWAGVLPQFREMRDLVQAGMFPGLKDAISDILQTNGPMLRDFMGRMGTTLGDMFRQFGDMMTSPQWMGIWATFSQYAPRFMEQFGQVGMAFLTFFGELFRGLAPYAERFGDALVGLAQSSADWMAAFVDSQTFRDIMDWLFTNGPLVFATLWDIARAIGNILVALEPYGRAVLGILDTVAEHIAGMDTDKLGTIVTALIGVVIAFQLAAGAISILGGLTAVLAGPLTAIIFAVVAIGIAFAALYTYSEDFRNGVNDMFGRLGEALSRLWNAVLGPIFDAFGKSSGDMGDVINVLGAIVGFVLEVMITKWIWMANMISWFYENIVWPVLGAFGKAGKWLWEEVLKPAWDGITTGWEMLVDGIKWAWDNILKPVWDVLVGVAQVMFAILTIAIFAPLMLAWWALSEGIKYAYEHWIEPTIRFFGEQWDAFYKFIEPGLKLLGFVWDLVLLGMQKTYENVIYPYIIKPFKDVFTDLWSYIQTAVNGIGEAWGWLKDKMQVPINWVIKFVLNDGLFAAYNWIIDKIGLTSLHIDPFDLIGDKRYEFAAGGRVPGWSPNDKADNIPAMLTAGEYVHPVDSVNYYGADVMELIRKKKLPKDALAGLAHDPRQHYATGGFVTSRKRPDEAVYMQPQNIYGAGDRVILPANAATGAQLFAIVKAAFPRARMNDGYRPGANDLHGRNMAVDLGEEGFSGGLGRPYLAAMNRWIYDNFRSSTSELIYTGLGDDRPDLKNAANYNYGLATNLGHKNHVHWAMVGQPGAPAASAFAGASANGTAAGSDPGFWGSLWGTVSDWTGKVWNNITDVFGSLKDSIVGPVKDFLGKFGENEMTRIIADLPGKTVDNVWGFLKDKVSDWFSFGGTDSPDNSAIIPNSQKSGEVQNAVRAVAARYGWNQGKEWESLYALIQKESGWNPNAQNPTSTAYGLFQFLNGTWAQTGVRKSSNVDDQATAGMQYISSRYGSPSKAWAFHQANNWYSEGGQVTDGGSAASPGAAPAPTLYDTGGWLPPGITTVLNATTKPEPILTAEQWSELTAGRDEDGPARGFRDLHLHEQAYDVSDAIDTVNHEVRKMQRTGGRYAGAGTGGN